MNIEQNTTSRLIADKGKVFRRKTDGYIMGDTITLGYDYYNAEIPLSMPHATSAEDYEEIETPTDWKKADIIHQVSRLKRTDEIIKQNIAEMNSLDLSANEALEVAHWFPTLYETEGYKEGDAIFVGARVQYNGKLWEARQDMNIVSHFPPSLATASLWCEVVAEGSEMGSLDNPIAYNGNMALESGKYYSEKDVTYLCIRDTGAPIYNALADLIGIYVQVA